MEGHIQDVKIPEWADEGERKEMWTVSVRVHTLQSM